MSCIAVKDEVRCQHEHGHSGKHYALITGGHGERRSLKWVDSESTHVALTETEFVPAPVATDAAYAYRAYVLEVQKVALLMGLSFDAAERVVQAAKEEYLARDSQGEARGDGSGFDCARPAL